MNNKQLDNFNFNKNFRVNNYKSKQQKGQLLQMSNNLNWQRRARSVAPKNKKFQQKREFSKQKEGNLNENYSKDFENKFEEKEEGRELQLNNFVDEISKIKLLLTNLECSTQFWNIQREENNKRNNLFNLQQQTSSMNFNNNFLLNSDLPIIEEQLNNIKKSLEEFRKFKINQPVKEYFRQNGRNETNLIKEKEFISPLQIKSRILNMEFHIEKRIQNILNEKRNKKVFDNSTTKINNNEEVFELITTKNQNNLDNEIVLGKISERENVGNEGNITQQQQQKNLFNEELKSNLNIFNYNKLLLNPNNKIQNNDLKQLNNSNFVEEEENKLLKEEINGSGGENSKEVFEPIRNFVFDNSNNEGITKPILEENLKIENQQELQQQQQQPTQNLSENPTQEQINFEKMLQILKNPTKFNISSNDTSSADELEIKTNLETKQTENEQKQINQQNIPLNTTAPTTLQTIGGFSNNNIQKQIINGQNESDSDSDFFK